jgi:hypothetical protein
MKNAIKILLLILTGCTLAQAQPMEHTYNWGNFDHSAWKIQPNSPTDMS